MKDSQLLLIPNAVSPIDKMITYVCQSLRYLVSGAAWLAFLLVSSVLDVHSALALIPVNRPPENTGTGFFVSGGELYDSNGIPFRIRGVNHTHSFGYQPSNTAAIPEIAKSQANAVRMVFFGRGAGITLTPSEQRARVVDYLQRDIVPIVELHDYTGGNNDTDGQAIVQAVDYWLQPERKAYLKEFEQEIILNIANEWGPNSTVWRDAYIAGVQRLRDAGINNLIMIDAGGNFGQNPKSIKSWGLEILNADPQKNILFSQHMYGYWFTSSSVPGWAYSVQDELAAIKALGIPLVVGEFGWEDHSEVNYDTSDAIAAFEQNGVGWLAWAWYRGAEGDSLSLIKEVFGNRNYQYNSDNDLTEYGNLVINDPVFGFKTANRTASIFWDPGDFNGDTYVDGADFLGWQRGQSLDPLAETRLSEWQSHYGQNSNLARVPEPASLYVLTGGVCLTVGCRPSSCRKNLFLRPNRGELCRWLLI